MALGFVGGFVLSQILKRIHNNGTLEANATVFVSYLIFFLAEGTTLHVSGILSIVTLGLYMTNSGKNQISRESEHAVHHVWGFIGFVAETVIFIVTGVILGTRFLGENDLTYIDYLKTLGIYVVLHFIRFFCIFLHWPALMRMGYGMSFKQIILSTYAGLRGAVGLSLALIVAASPGIDRYVQDLVLLDVGGIALLTLLINATTTGHLVKYLGLSQQSPLELNTLRSLTVTIDKNIDKNIEVLRSNKNH